MAGQRLEDTAPDPLPAPAVKAVVDRRVGPVLGRAVAPSSPRLQHVHDPADHPVIVHPSRTATPPRQVRLNPRPRLVIQPVKLPHPKLPSRSLESKPQLIRQRLIEYGP